MRIDHPENMEIGDVFYESGYGMDVMFVVTKKPEIIHSNENVQLVWEGKKDGDLNNPPTKFLITKGFEHYGPKIYTQPMYIQSN